MAQAEGDAPGGQRPPEGSLRPRCEPEALRPHAALSPPKRRSRGRRRRRRRRLRSVRWSSSSEASDSGDSSSGDSRDSESEPEPARGPQEGGQSRPPAQHTVPDVDLWVPARQSAHALGPGGYPGCSAASPSRPQASSAAHGGSRDVEEVGSQAASGTHSTSLGGIGSPPCTDAHPRSSEGPANEVGMALGCPGAGDSVL